MFECVFWVWFICYNRTMLRQWNIDDKELDKKCIDEIITRVQDIDNPETVGMIAAQELIDIVLENYGARIYDSALDAATKQVNEKMLDIEYSLQEMKQS